MAPTPQLAAALGGILDTERPEIVYLPFFLEEHPDHRAATALLAAAVQDGKHAFQCNGYEVWTPLFPNCFVKIDATIEPNGAR